MITGISLVGLTVSDQDEALRFWVDRVGFECRLDDTATQSGYRWVEVAASNGAVRITLSAASVADRPRPGQLAGFILEADDLDATHASLTSHGVEFVEPPTDQPWGRQAVFKDQDGQHIVVVQP